MKDGVTRPDDLEAPEYPLAFQIFCPEANAVPGTVP